MSDHETAEQVMASLDALQTTMSAEIAATKDRLRHLFVKERRLMPGDDVQHVLNTEAPDVALVFEPGQYQPIVLPPHSGLMPRVLKAVPGASLPHFRALGMTSSQPAVRVTGGRYLLDRLSGSCQNPAATIVIAGSPTETDVTKQPDDVSLLKVQLRGDATNGQKRGLALHAGKALVVGCSITDIKYNQQDSQAIYGNNGPGPWHIEGNVLEATGENIMFGGDRAPTHVVPRGIAILGNTVRKPHHWKAEAWQHKNLLEFKTGRDAVVRGNVFDGCWQDAQNGYAILFTPVNQYGDCPEVSVQNIVFERNLVINVSSAINISGVHADNDFVSGRTADIAIRENLILVSRSAWGGDGRVLMVGGGPQRVIFDNNTAISDGSSTIYTYRGRGWKPSEGCAFRSNLFLHNTYGFTSEDAVGLANATLVKFYPGAVFEGNVVGGGGKSYPAGTLTPSKADFMAGFVDTSSYRVRPDAPWVGKGANVGLLPAA